jgi:hypothetical protein
MENNLKNSIEFINYSVGKQHGFIVPENYFNELENEITSNQIASNLPNENSYEVPENYFDNLENELAERISEVNIPKKVKFSSVPEGYFDSLEDSVFEKINKEEKNVKPVKVISLYTRVKKFIPVAAAAIVLIFIGTYFLNSLTTSDSQIKETEIVTWFQNGFGETNPYEIATLFSNEDLSYNDFTVSVSSDNIEDYLNTIDTSTLIEFEEIELTNDNEL